MNDDKPLYEEESFWQRVKESPRTVSALIIILIVAAAIYAFSGDDQNTPGEVAEEAATTEEATEAVAVTEEGETKAEATNQVAAGTTETADATTATVEVVEEEPVELPEARKTAEGYVEVAEAGQGYTHLARKATTRWLSENQASYSVTDEHRIFIEDYIQNRIGTSGMTLGAEHTITFDLMEEAVAKAGELTDGQLNNLTQYTTALN